LFAVFDIAIQLHCAESAVPKQKLVAWQWTLIGMVQISVGGGFTTPTATAYVLHSNAYAVYLYIPHHIEFLLNIF
jgi:hypothetical protein